MPKGNEEPTIYAKARILKDKTMDSKLMYNPKDDKQIGIIGWKV